MVKAISGLASFVEIAFMRFRFKRTREWTQKQFAQVVWFTVLAKYIPHLIG